MATSVPRLFPAEFLCLDAALKQTLDDLENQRKQQHSAAMVVYRKAKKEKQKRTLARVRLAKRVRCPLDILLGISYTKEKDLSPVIVAPIGFGIRQRHEVSTQLLQEFDQDALVFAHHIPSPEKNLRYIYFARRAQWQLRDGRRKLELSMSIVNAHFRRDTEGLQENVEWVNEGGVNISMIEVDGTFIDIVCDRWASCQSKLQADYNMVQ